LTGHVESTLEPDRSGRRGRGEDSRNADNNWSICHGRSGGVHNGGTNFVQRFTGQLMLTTIPAKPHGAETSGSGISRSINTVHAKHISDAYMPTREHLAWTMAK